MDNTVAFKLCDLLKDGKCNMEQIYEKYNSQLFKFMNYIEVMVEETSSSMWQWSELISIDNYLKEMEWRENGINGYVSRTRHLSEYEKCLLSLDRIPVSFLHAREFNKSSSISGEVMDKILDAVEDLDEPKIKSKLLSVRSYTERFLKFTFRECPIYDEAKVGLGAEYFSENLTDFIRKGYLDNLDVSYIALVVREESIDYSDLMSELINLENANSELSYLIFCKLSEKILTYVDVKDIPKEFLARGLVCGYNTPTNLLNKLFLIDDEDLVDKCIGRISNHYLPFKSYEQLDKYRERLLEHALKTRVCPYIIINNEKDASLFTEYLIGMYENGNLDEVYPMLLHLMTREQLDRVHSSIPEGLSREVDKSRGHFDSKALDGMPEIDF